MFCSGCEVSRGGHPTIGDVIVEVGGEHIASSEDVLGIVEQFSVGDQVPITVMRGKEKVTVIVPLLPDA